MKVVFFPFNKRNISILLAFLVLAAVILPIFLLYNESVTTSVSKDQIHQDLVNMFLLRDKVALDRNVNGIKNIFDTNSKLGRWAFEHERNRANYLHNWAIIRKTKFTVMSSDIIIQRVRDKGGSIWVDFLHSGKFTYIYPHRPNEPVTFGIGSRRTIELSKGPSGWIIKREWYLDPFEGRLEIPDEFKSLIPKDSNPNNAPIIADNSEYSLSEVEPAATKPRKRFDREKAVAYADKYSGATFGSGNNFKYNKKYRDYVPLGGDCANFTSQILTDPEAGGLRMDGSWFYNFKYKKTGGGTRSWIKASALKDYLLYSGKASLIGKGTLQEVSSPSNRNPEGAYKKLQKADVIAYEVNGDIDHVSVVTAFDPEGVPLVNSHSTDRYRVPWDLGWADRDVKYWLLHMRD